MRACDPNTWKLEAGGSEVPAIFNHQRVWGQPGFRKKTEQEELYNQPILASIYRETQPSHLKVQ